jgi:hypothetical protein
MRIPDVLTTASFIWLPIYFVKIFMNVSLCRCIIHERSTHRIDRADEGLAGIFVEGVAKMPRCIVAVTLQEQEKVTARISKMVDEGGPDVVHLRND